LLLFRQRLCTGGWLWFAAKECKQLIPEAICLFSNFNDLVSRCLNLNKGFLGLLVQLASGLDVLNQPSGKQTDADRINLQPLEL